MTTLLMIRHGQSEGNINHIFVGHQDSPLTELGKLQAIKTADYICKNYSVDLLFASDLCRAFETGQAAAKACGIPIIAHPGLREIYAGDWENVSFDNLSIKYKNEYSIWKNDIGNAKCTNGESVQELKDRVVCALIEICERHPGKTIAVATHATPIRVLMCQALADGNLDRMKDISWVSNASVTIVYYDSGKFSIIQASLDGHLGNLKTTLPSNV